MTRLTTFSPILVITPTDQARQCVDTVIQQKLPGFNLHQAMWLTEPDQLPSIEQLRQALYNLSFRLGAEENRVCIIPQLDHAPIELSHTLLKTLEEPPARTLILLTVDSTQGLLPTLISRCQITQPIITRTDETASVNPGLVLANQLVDSLSVSTLYQIWSQLPKTMSSVQAVNLLNQLTYALMPRRLTTIGRQMLRLILNATSQLHTNAHVRLTIENCLLQLYVLAKGAKTATKT